MDLSAPVSRQFMAVLRDKARKAVAAAYGKEFVDMLEERAASLGRDFRSYAQRVQNDAVEYRLNRRSEPVSAPQHYGHGYLSGAQSAPYSRSNYAGFGAGFRRVHTNSFGGIVKRKPLKRYRTKRR